MSSSSWSTGRTVAAAAAALAVGGAAIYAFKQYQKRPAKVPSPNGSKKKGKVNNKNSKSTSNSSSSVVTKPAELTWVEFAKQLHAAKQYEQAANAWGQAIDEEQVNMERKSKLLINRCSIFLILRRYEEAQLDASQSIQLVPEGNANAFYNLGRALMGLGAWGDALQVFQHSLTQSNSNKNPEIAKFVPGYIAKCQTQLGPEFFFHQMQMQQQMQQQMEQQQSQSTSSTSQISKPLTPKQAAVADMVSTDQQSVTVTATASTSVESTAAETATASSSSPAEVVPSSSVSPATVAATASTSTIDSSISSPPTEHLADTDSVTTEESIEHVDFPGDDSGSNTSTTSNNSSPLNAPSDSAVFVSPSMYESSVFVPTSSMIKAEQALEQQQQEQQSSSTAAAETAREHAIEQAKHAQEAVASISFAEVVKHAQSESEAPAAAPAPAVSSTLSDSDSTSEVPASSSSTSTPSTTEAEAEADSKLVTESETVKKSGSSRNNKKLYKKKAAK